MIDPCSLLSELTGLTRSGDATAPEISLLDSLGEWILYS
jgi:hypothetical protein